MKATVFILGTLASIAVADSHAHGHGHGHNNAHRRRAHHQHHKRATVVEWVTETVWETVTEIVDKSSTETIFPKSTFTPPAAAAAPATTGRPGQFFEGATVIQNAPAQTSQPAPAPYVSTAPAAPLRPANMPSAHSPPPSPTPVASQPSPPAPVANNPPPPPQVQVADPNPAPVPGGATTHAGDLTFFTLGLGACGFNDAGKDHSTNVVALSYRLMGDRSNDNPYCGRTITISYGGKTTTAVVRDKCMGCAHDNIDASEALFTFFQPLSTGRFQVQWWFND